MKAIFKFLLAAVLVVSMVFVISGGSRGEGKNPVQPRSFTDLSPDHWAYNVINQMVKRDLLVGYPDGSFQPEAVLSRAEFAALLARVAGFSLLPVAKPSHADVLSSDWYASSVEQTYRYMGDYIQPDSTRLFKPEEAVLREQAIAALVRIADGERKPMNSGILSSRFKDYNEISPELRQLVAWAVEEGKAGGYPDGTFRPKNKLTRAEAAALVTRLFPLVELSIEGLMSSGKLVPQLRSEGYEQLTELLLKEYSFIPFNENPVNVSYFVRDLLAVPGLEVLYVFIRVDPFKYFTFSDVDFKKGANVVQEFNDVVARRVSKGFPDKQVVVMVGYTNILYYNPQGVYEQKYITFNKDEQSWQINRFYTGVRAKKGEILEKWRANEE